MLGKTLTTILIILATACGTRGESNGADTAKQNSARGDRRALADVCAVARHPERLDGQRVRLRAIVVQDIESAKLTLPACMARRWDGYVRIDGSRKWGFSGIGAAIIEAGRRSTASRTLVAEGEFEGIVHARLRQAPVNVSNFGPMPPYVAMLDVVNVDHVRLVDVPAVQRLQVPTISKHGGNE